MKEKILIMLFAMLVPFEIWASSTKMDYKDGDSFTAYVPLNGNDSVNMIFTVINEMEKNVSVGLFDSDTFIESADSAYSTNDSLNGKIEIPSLINGYTVKAIGSCAFYGDSGLTSISLPPTITEIGYYAFYNCRELTSINIPDSVSSIRDNAFDGCESLTSITLSNSIIYIGRKAFGNCLKVIIPSSSIPNLEYWYTDYWNGEMFVDAFSSDCKIYVPASLLDSYKKDYTWGLIGSQIFAIEGETFYDITVHAKEETSAISSIIGEKHLSHIISLKLAGTINGYDIQVIRDRMPLLRQLDLTDVVIVANSYPYYTDENGNNYYSENNVLGDYCFANMADLQTFHFPRNVQKIGQYSFYGCKTLKNIKIPKGTVYIGDYAFAGCSLNNVIVYNTEPAQIFSSTFPNRANVSLSVLEGSKEKYMFANFWKDFKDLIDSTDIIYFKDEKVGEICVSNWDTNGDGVLSLTEAANVESIADIGTSDSGVVSVYKSPFLKTEITSFDELKFFTGLTDIPGWTFYDCKSLSSIVIPQNVVSIGGGYSSYGPTGSCNEASVVTWQGRDELGAFNGCSNLVSVTIPESVKSIDKFAFLGCDNLKEVHISNLRSWMEIDFGDMSANPLSYAHRLILDKQEITKIQIPDDMTTIKKYVFCGGEGIVSLTLPNTVTSIEVGAFHGCCHLKSIDIPSSIGKIGGFILNWEDNMQCEYINDTGVFEGCSSLKSVNISKSVTCIGAKTFKGCSSLMSVIIPKNVSEIQGGAFEGCTSLKSINLPVDFVTLYFSSNLYELGTPLEQSYNGIGARMFYGCSNLTSITIPECVDSIGEDAFYGCDNLSFVKVKKSSPITIDESTFPTRANIPLYVPMGSGKLYRAADYWKEFKEVIEVENIDDYVQGEIFTAPVDLVNGNTIPMTFKVIDAGRKYVTVGDRECVSILTTASGGLIIPDTINGYTVTEINWNAFKDCNELTSIYVPKTVKSIGYDSFRGCSNVISMVVDDENTVFDSRNDCNAIIGKSSKTLIAGCQTTVIPNDVVKIGDHAFYGQTSLTSINVPSSVKSLGSGAFYDCHNLETVELQNGLTTIGSCSFQNCVNLVTVNIPCSVNKIEDYAFLNCGSLTSISIPESVTSIGGYAFYKCGNLTSVVVRVSEPLPIISNVFTNRTNATLYVQRGRKTAYLTANFWNEFKMVTEIGDVNSDGMISVTDAVAIINIILGKDGSNTLKISADLNNDGTVTVSDAVNLINSILNDSSYSKENVMFKNE